MDIDFKKLAPWNWFKKEQEEQQSTASLPVQRNDLPVAGGPVSPILQLHREIDRLFDDAFRGFGLPTHHIIPQYQKQALALHFISNSMLGQDNLK